MNARTPFAISTSDAVRHALGANAPIVALESTIFSNLGLPAPANAEALARSKAAIEASSAVPAVCAVLDGVATVGLEDAEEHLILGAATKTASRDLGVAIAQRWKVGATTVSGTMALCAAAGVEVFATGGIGGVHRGAAETGDISADLAALAQYPVACVSAGAKAFLDLGLTLEHLDTLGVPVIGLATDEFPAFYSRTSGFAVPHSVDTPGEVAEIVAAARSIGYGGGFLVVAPVPADAEIPAEEIDDAIVSALASAEAAGVAGGEITPHILGAIASATAGRSVTTNLALAENNAAIAGEIAAVLKT